eukprot:8486134-Heterocapsa_arctica.AAC.1
MVGPSRSRRHGAYAVVAPIEELPVELPDPIPEELDEGDAVGDATAMREPRAAVMPRAPSALDRERHALTHLFAVVPRVRSRARA